MTDSQETEILKNNSAKSQDVENSKEPVENNDDKQRSVSTSDDNKKKANVEKPEKGKNGGARPGAGRPKGGMNKASITKMEAKKKFELRVAKQADVLYNAQFTLATGTQYLFKRFKIEYKDKKGNTKWKWSPIEIVSDPNEIASYLDGEYKDDDTTYYMITAEKPDVKAIDSLLDRSFGKAPQSLKIHDDRPDPIGLILAQFGITPDTISLTEGEESSDDGEVKNTEGTSPQESA